MNKGFIALTLVLSVSTLLLGLVAASSLQSFTFFDQVMKKQYRFMNRYNALNCIDQAILELAHDYFYITETARFIPHFQCSIISVRAEGDLRYISTRGDLEKAYIYRSAVVRMRPQELEVIEIE